MEEQQVPQQSGSSSVPPQKTSMGMEPNLAAALSYVCGWLTGLVIFLMEKENNFVRFHALQSLITFGGFTVIWIGLNILHFIPVVGALYWVLTPVVGIASLIAWVILILKAYQGERFHFPITGEIAEKNLK
jgi:uncharacterized membrane protein